MNEQEAAKVAVKVATALKPALAEVTTSLLNLAVALDKVLAPLEPELRQAAVAGIRDACGHGLAVIASHETIH